MKRCFCVLGLLLAVTSSAQAQVAGDDQPGVAFGSKVVATSRYIWRGFEDGGFSIQPSTWMQVGGFKAKSWFNLAANPTERSSLTEQDVTVQYTRNFGTYAVTGGWNGYFFPSGYGHSHEAFVSVERAGPLTPSFAVYRDFRLGNGSYVNAGVAHAWPAFIPALGLSSTFTVGYNHHHWTDVQGFSDANVGLRATWQATRRVAIGPFVNHSRSLNRAIVPTHTYGGVELAVR